MGWLAVLFLLGCIPVGVYMRYDASGFSLQIVASFFRYTVIPFPKRKKAPKEAKKETGDTAAKTAAPSKPTKQAAPARPVQRTAPTGGSVMDFMPLVRIGLDFLNAFRRKLRVNHLMCRVILAGDDPCDVGISYGRAWEAVGSILPILERRLVIKKRDIEVECDFTSTQPRILFAMELTITIGRVLLLGIVYGIRCLIAFLKIKKKRKGGVPA